MCQYCEPTQKGYGLHFGEVITLDHQYTLAFRVGWNYDKTSGTTFPVIIGQIDDLKYLSNRINYCPICGKKLEVDEVEDV